MISTEILPLSIDDAPRFQAHFKRHRGESGRGESHFLPFSPTDPDGPIGLDIDALSKPLTEPGWQRCFVAIDEHDEIVGHVELRTENLQCSQHRCQLGIGVERAYRGQGLGRRLMQTAIEFARSVDAIDWLDLRVFTQNVPARILYSTLGFTEVATIRDRFRVDGAVIDDIFMTLDVS